MTGETHPSISHGQKETLKLILKCCKSIIDFKALVFVKPLSETEPVLCAHGVHTIRLNRPDALFIFIYLSFFFFLIYCNVVLPLFAFLFEMLSCISTSEPWEFRDWLIDSLLVFSSTYRSASASFVSSSHALPDWCRSPFHMTLGFQNAGSSAKKQRAFHPHPDPCSFKHTI